MVVEASPVAAMVQRVIIARITSGHFGIAKGRVA